MSHIIDLDAHRPHEAGYQICRACGHVQVAVAPVGAPERMECSACGEMAAEWATEDECDLIEARSGWARLGARAKALLREAGGGYAFCGYDAEVRAAAEEVAGAGLGRITENDCGPILCPTTVARQALAKGDWG